MDCRSLSLNLGRRGTSAAYKVARKAAQSRRSEVEQEAKKGKDCEEDDAASKDESRRKRPNDWVARQTAGKKGKRAR